MAKDPSPSKEVPHSKVASRDPAVEDRVNIGLETPSYAAGDVIAVAVHTSLVDLEKRMEKSEKVLNE